ncbi:MAG: AbfB domain-containing protein [Bacteroidales bacterium]|nr:AbfB domain-containing protein [Bacteroidales bacterium]
MKKFLTFLVFAIFAITLKGQTWQVVWADEFNGSIGPDWVYDIGTGSGGWGNNELQYYRSQNASVVNNALQIQARLESYGGMAYTSARMKTQGRRSWRYGRVEARIQLPSFTGSWPAFWMLGDNIGSVGWPACGKIDIMEHVNTEGVTYGTIHWDYNGYASYSGSTGVNVTAYHVYRIDWDANSIKWFVDGAQFHEANIANSINGTNEFHNNFFILLNMAIGGNWPGFTIDNNAFPANMRVDWVRVSQQTSTPPPPSGYVSWQSHNFPNRYIRHAWSRGRIDPNVTPAADQNWLMVSGLAGSGVSFQSQNFPNRYLRHRRGEIWLDVYDGSQLFREDATFHQRAGLADGSKVSFESYNYPGRYIRHRNSLLYITTISTTLDRNDATFAQTDPKAGIEYDISISENVKVFPLPADDFINITGLKNDVAILEIFDLTGKRCVSVVNNSSATVLDLSGLNSGMYILRVVTDTFEKSIRITKN